MSEHSPDPLTGQSGMTAETETEAEAPRPAGEGRRIINELLGGSAMVGVLAIVLALAVGGVLIALVDPDVQATAAYLFARPSDFLFALWESVAGAYAAMFQGAVFNAGADSFGRAIRPLTETMTVATPLILAGLGIAVAFRAGLFNIGAQGQVLIGATLSAYIGFRFDLPIGAHLLLAMCGGILGGALWAGIAGYLRARFGANEVIVTIMLNYVGSYLVAYLLTQSFFTGSESTQPRTASIRPTAEFPTLLNWGPLPRLFGTEFRLHLGFVVAILAAVFVWWLMTRSNVGFKFRAVGENADAARTAGISVTAAYFGVMVVAGALTGLAGSAQVMGTEKFLTDGIAGSIGFDAITVALLGRSRPLGVFFAGLLFGALSAGGRVMEIKTGTPIDIVQVVQSLIVLFIAAPPLVRSVFRIGRRRSAGKERVA